MDKKTKKFLIICSLFITGILLYKYLIDKDINDNKVIVVGEITGKITLKGTATNVGIVLHYKGNKIEVVSAINTYDWKLYEVGSCYEVEISSKNPKHCRITPKQVPCP